MGGSLKINKGVKAEGRKEEKGREGGRVVRRKGRKKKEGRP